MTAVPYRLRRVDSAHSPTAFLLLSESAADLLRAVGRTGVVSWPAVHAVPGGFLVNAPRTRESRVLPIIPLRALAENLFVPVDADLEPALFPDEAQALTRSRGLVFLPGGATLGFTPGQPILAAHILTAPPAAPADWQPLAGRPPRAEHVREVVRVLPEDALERVFRLEPDESAAGDGAPAAPGWPTALADHAAAGVGRGLLWLANLLRWRQLAEAGAGLVGRALAREPQIRESVLGKQEAQLRDLLREFREGNLERALRRALPMGGPGDRGNAFARDARLPNHNPRFSLADLLSAGRGPASVWVGGGDVQALLAAEYRQVAARAIREGDFRRAAFVYGKLLRDFGQAAAALERGALHREAAFLYLEKLGDRAAAARAFAAAGDLDRAIALYRQEGQHASAGDLLRRQGDDEAALAEYVLEATALARGHNHLAAGDLLRLRGGRLDLALPYYVAGWEGRTLPNAPACLHRLAELYADEPTPDHLLRLVEEADPFLAGLEPDVRTTQFYEHVLRLAARPRLAAVREDLVDRARCAFGRRLRARAARAKFAGDAVSTLMGRSALWDSATVSDAEFAYRLAAGQRAAPAPGAAPVARQRLPLYGDMVTAACAAPETGVLFVGFADGTIVAFDPVSGCTATYPPLAGKNGLVGALSTDRRGDTLVSLRHGPPEHGTLTSYRRLPTSTDSFGFRVESTRELPGFRRGCLTPIAPSRKGDPVLGVSDGRWFALTSATQLVTLDSFEPRCEAPDCLTADLARPRADEELPAVIYGNGHALMVYRFGAGVHTRIPVEWTPDVPDGVALLTPTLSAVDRGTMTIIWGVNREGLACVSALTHTANGFDVAGDWRWSKEPVRGVAMLPVARLAVLTQSGIVWLRCGSNLTMTGKSTIDFRAGLACFASPLTGEVLVVSGGGELLRVPVP